MDRPAELFAHSIRIARDRSARQETDSADVIKKMQPESAETEYRTDLCFAKTSMSEHNSRLGNKPMPQLDFRQAFASADQKPSPADSAQINHANHAGDPMEQRVSARSTRTNPINRSNWANITFVAVTFIGGLFCAFYFFNGADLLRAAAAWPREFLYSRPFGIVGKGKIDKLHGADDPSSPFGPDSPASSKADPFRRVGFRRVGF